MCKKKKKKKKKLVKTFISMRSLHKICTHVLIIRSFMILSEGTYVVISKCRNIPILTSGEGFLSVPDQLSKQVQNSGNSIRR
jgi:hypothetical protein